MLRAESLSFAHGAQTVLSSIDFSVAPGDRLAVVGPNGVGKSTLLSLLAGDLTPESGTVITTGTVGLLPQERDLKPGENIAGYLARRTGVAGAERELESAAQELAEDAPGAAERYAVALDRFLALGGADLDTRASALCADLGVTTDHDRPTASLSGGQVARLALAATMLAQFDVTLLDEPGNDLDLDGLTRLEGHLRSLRGGVVLVSHDRELLTNVASEVLQIDPHSRVGTVYAGGFAAYLTELERDQLHRRQEYDDYAAERNELLGRARKQKEWARAGAQRANSAAARIKEPDRNIRYGRQQSAEQLGAKAAATLRKLDRLDVVEEPRKEWRLQLRFGEATHSGSVVATVSGAVVRRGEFQLGPIDLQLNRGDRLALIGSNGSGKSTLIEAMLGRVELTAGTSTLGAGVVVGEIDQRRTRPDADATLLDEFAQQSALNIADARTLLAKFGLGADDVLRPAGSLSPGERTRGDLAMLVQSEANLLILDEPTNHLDLPAIRQLEQALNVYDGTLILVTHDRRFLENVGVTKRLELRDGVVVVD